MGKLARLSRTTIPTISLVEAGTRSPPKASVTRWAKALDLTGDDKREFLIHAKRAKWKKNDAYERVLALEERPSAALTLFDGLLRKCVEKGVEIPKEFAERLEALRDPL